MYYGENIMSKKIIKKIACGALAAISVVACAGTFTACETSNPEVTMQIEFNGETYNLEYKLYRKITPATVDHFLWLVENEYYNGLCVHDYDADGLKMYTGAYSAAEDATDTDGLTYQSYYEVISKYENYASFPHSVWTDSEKTNAAYTLYGEFENNNFRVTNGALKQSFGSLTMYYHNISSYDASENYVYVKRADNGELTAKEYKYNSATSQFFISLTTGETSSSSYCTFATLKNKGELEEFQEDLAVYISENYGTTEDDEDEFVNSHTVTVCEDDAFVGDYSVQETFEVPETPIVINYIKVTKY